GDTGLVGRSDRAFRSVKTQIEPISSSSFKNDGDAVSFDRIDLTKPSNSRFGMFGIWWRRFSPTFECFLFCRLNRVMWRGSTESASWSTMDDIWNWTVLKRLSGSRWK